MDTADPSKSISGTSEPLRSPSRPTSLEFRPDAEGGRGESPSPRARPVPFLPLTLPTLFQARHAGRRGSRTTSPLFLPTSNTPPTFVTTTTGVFPLRNPGASDLASGTSRDMGRLFAPMMKRSNSAPVINVIGGDGEKGGGEWTWNEDERRESAMSRLRPSSQAQEKCDPMDVQEASSGSFSPRSRHSSSSRSVTGVIPVRIPAKRVHAIRRESSVSNCISSDVAREKFVQSSAIVSNHLEDFTLSEEDRLERKRTKSLTEPISVFTHFLPSSSCSPSPNSRLDKDKQCYSPSTQQIVRNNIGLSPSPSPTPSPTRRSAVLMRSLSPIAIRPTVFGLKRKCESEAEGYTNSPKRANYYSLSFAGSGSSLCSLGNNSSPVPLTPDRDRGIHFPTSHLVKHSISLSSDSESSNGAESTVSDVATTSSSQSFVSLSASSTPNPGGGAVEGEAEDPESLSLMDTALS